MQPVDIQKILQELTYQPNAPLIFSSALFMYLFVGFLAIYLLVYKHTRLRILYLTLFSFYFYYKSSGLYFILLLILTISDFNIAHFIHQSRKKWLRTFLLVTSLTINLGMLAYLNTPTFCSTAFTSY